MTCCYLCITGTYPHIPATQTPGSGTGSCRGGGGGLTEQEMQAVAVAAAEQGYDDREYYVDDGGDNYYDDYADQDLSSYVGAEGRIDRYYCSCV